MSVQYPLAGPPQVRLVPTDTDVCSPVPARLAHKVAHKNTRRLPRPAGYRFVGQWSAHTLELCQRFLGQLERECSSAVTEWRDLLPVATAAIERMPGEYLTSSGLLKSRRGVPDPEADAAVVTYAAALEAWLDKYELNAYWIRTLAHSRFVDTVNQRYPLRLAGGISTDIYYSPTIKGFTYEAPPSYGNETPSTYKRRVLADFKSALDGHIRAALAAFEKSPEVEIEPKVSDDVLRQAVRWQVLEDRPMGDREAVRQVLKRLDFTPRRGL